MRYAIFYDHNKLEILGSDGVWKFDQRFSNDSILAKLFGQENGQLQRYNNKTTTLKPRCYVSIVSGPRIGYVDRILVDSAMLVDPMDII